MKIVKDLSIIGLAAYLVLQGLDSFVDQASNFAHPLVGLIGLGTGALIFVSLGRWIHPKS